MTSRTCFFLRMGFKSSFRSQSTPPSPLSTAQLKIRTGSIAAELPQDLTGDPNHIPPDEFRSAVHALKLNSSGRRKKNERVFSAKCFPVSSDSRESCDSTYLLHTIPIFDFGVAVIEPSRCLPVRHIDHEILFLQAFYAHVDFCSTEKVLQEFIPKGRELTVSIFTISIDVHCLRSDIWAHS